MSTGADTAARPVGRVATLVRIEVVAALLVPAATFGFVRLFTDGAAVGPLVVASLASSVLGFAMRRLRVPLPIAALISVGALWVLLQARYAPGTARFGIVPTGETLDAFSALVDEGAVQFRELRAPVQATPPFVAASMVAVWLMAFLTDWGAMRLRLAFEPVLPAGLIFIFGAVVGSGDHRYSSTAVFAAAVIAWAIAQRSSAIAERGVWLTADRTRGPSVLARHGLVLAAMALFAGFVAGPRLPGAEADELYYWRSKGDSTRRVISPFVGIGDRLVDGQNDSLFTVTADQPAYWRLAGLDAFDSEENVWTIAGDFTPEDGRLPGERSRAGTTQVVLQTFEIEALAQIWLPAAFAPLNLIDSDVDATWNAETSSLTVSQENESSDGFSYSVESVVPMFTPDELRAAPASVPGNIAERYLSLPDDLTQRALDEATRVTAGATTRYDQMLALQEYFRAFDYSVSLGPRGDDPIETFLDERLGFCQQFSGTFALMARSLGAPARVAVGFTWGDPVDGEPNTYQVTGRHAHAWPEVWFDGLGWVAFEPTPGRGAPNSGYTNVAARQDSATQPDAPGETTTSTRPDVAATPVTQPPNIPDFTDIEPGSTGTVTEPGRSIPWRLLAVVAAIGAYVVAMPALHRLRRARRRDRATTGQAQVETAWAEAAEALGRGFDHERRPSETRTEFAHRLRHDRRLPDGALAELAEATTEARYRADSLPPEVVDRAWALSSSITTRVGERTTRWKRWRDELDPRRLFTPTRRLVIEPARTPATAS